MMPKYNMDTIMTCHGSDEGKKYTHKGKVSDSISLDLWPILKFLASHIYKYMK